MGSISFIGASGGMLTAEAYGPEDAPIVLMIPAIGQLRTIWTGAAEALAQAGRRVICLDLRGHGGSDPAPDGRYDLSAYAADLQKVLGELPSRAAVVGVGPGGLAALIAAGEGPPGLASALVLIGVTAWVEEGTAGRIQTALARLKKPFADSDGILAAIAGVHPLEPEPIARERLLDGYATDAHGQWRWTGDPAVFGAFDLLSESRRIEAAAARLAMPVSLIRGVLNETVSLEMSERLQSHIAGAELNEIEGGGHHVVIDREDAFNAVLLEFLERRVPLHPLSYRGGADPRILRDALGCFGTGVTVVTTLDAEGNPIGFTANSFTSVSLDPPLVLFCISKRSVNIETYRNARSFAINILHIGQQPTSDRFARPSNARFEGVEWETRRPGGAPLLLGSRASFDCERRAVHDGGDHLIVLGEVKQADFEPHRDPLLYLQGRYRRVHFS